MDYIGNVRAQKRTLMVGDSENRSVTTITISPLRRSFKVTDVSQATFGELFFSQKDLTDKFCCIFHNDATFSLENTLYESIAHGRSSLCTFMSHKSLIKLLYG